MGQRLRPGPLKRRMMAAVPRRWTLLKAMDILGMPIRNRNPNTGAPIGRGNEGFHIHGRVLGGRSGTRGGWVPFEERMPGGPDYVYETAREFYLQAARRHHPDRGGKKKDMQAVNAAMEFVERRYGPNNNTARSAAIDPQARAAYRQATRGL